MSRPYQPRGAALRALILSRAATPEGYMARDAKHLDNSAQSAKTCERLMEAGLLHRVRRKTYLMRYFSTAEAAADFESMVPEYTPAQRHNQARARYAAKTAEARAGQPVRTPKPVKIIQRAAKQQMQVVERKPYHPPAPKRDAVVIWPAHIKPVCRMMPAPRNQVVTFSFVHSGIGQMR